MKRLLLFILFWTSLASAQVVGPGMVDYVTSAPSGTCSQGSHMQIVLGSGSVYTCQSGTWAQVSGGGGTGITGTLTSGNIPVATGAHTLGDGSVLDSGSGITERGTTFFGPAFSTFSAYSQAQLFTSGIPANITDTTNTDAAALQAAFQANTIGGGGMFGLGIADLAADTAVFTQTEGVVGWAYANLNNHTISNGKAGIGGVAGISAVTGPGHISRIFGIGAYGASANAAPTIDVNAGFWADAQSSSVGTLNAGLYIEDQTTGASNYGIYVVGGKNNLGPQTTTVGNLIDSGLSASLPVVTDGSKQLASGTVTGTGAFVLATSPTFITGLTSPVLSTSGSNGGITGVEGSGAGLTGASGTDLLFPDSTSHCWHGNLSNVDVGCAAFATNTITLTNKTLTTPTIASFTNATHNHTNAAGGGLLTGSAMTPLAVSGYFIPAGLPGALTNGTASLVSAQNEMDCVRFIAPQTITPGHFTYKPSTSAGSSTHVGLAMYSSDGTTRIWTTGAQDGTATATTTVAISSSPIVANTPYLYCWTNDAATSTTWAAFSLNTTITIYASVINTSQAPNMVTGATASVAGAPPTSLGALSARTTGNGIPGGFIEQ